MADVEAAVYAILKGNPAVTALLGGSSSPRIYPEAVPQEAALPAVAYMRVSTQRRHTHGARATIARPRVQTTVIGETYLSAKAVAAAVMNALDGYRGTAGGVTVHVAMSADEADEFAEGNRLYTVEQDWFIWHKE